MNIFLVPFSGVSLLISLSLIELCVTQPLYPYIVSQLSIQLNIQSRITHQLTYSLTTAFPMEIQIDNPRTLLGIMLQWYSMRLRFIRSVRNTPSIFGAIAVTNNPSDNATKCQ